MRSSLMRLLSAGLMSTSSLARITPTIVFLRGEGRVGWVGGRVGGRGMRGPSSVCESRWESMGEGLFQCVREREVGREGAERKGVHGCLVFPVVCEEPADSHLSPPSYTGIRLCPESSTACRHRSSSWSSVDSMKHLGVGRSEREDKWRLRERVGAMREWEVEV